MFLKTRRQKNTCIRISLCCLFLVYFVGSAGASHLDVLNNSCVDCHKALSPFTDEQKRFNEIRINHTERNISCSLECHEDVIRKRASDNFQQWSDSTHSIYYVTCDKCHGGDARANTESGAHASMKNITDPNSTIYFKNIPETCGKCHTAELDHFKNTMHYQRLRSTSQGPSCTTCHQPHSFKVLKSSELTNLCSACHNSVDQIATASVPQDAKKALEKAGEFQAEVMKAKNAIADAKAKGNDISSAQMNLDKANAVLDEIPSLWHGFDLKNFDEQIQSGVDWAKKAEYEASGAEPTVPRASWPGIVLLFGIFAIIYLIKKR